jgi:hypothetical protein
VTNAAVAGARRRPATEYLQGNWKEGLNPMARSAIQVRSALRAVRGAAAGLLVVVLAAGARAQSDELELKDGKKVSGTVQSANYGGLEFKTKQNAKQTHEWDKVQKLKFGGSVEFTDVVEKVGSASLDARWPASRSEGAMEAPPISAGGALLPRPLGAGATSDGPVAGRQSLKVPPTGRYPRPGCAAGRGAARQRKAARRRGKPSTPRQRGEGGQPRPALRPGGRPAEGAHPRGAERL